MTSIIVVVYNALQHVIKLFDSLPITKGEYEVIVVDNASSDETVKYLWTLRHRGLIQALALQDKNRLFAAGNNIGFGLISPKSDYVCLLNTDVELRHALWLEKLYAQKKDVVSYGWVPNPPRPDGWCCLIKREVYTKFPIDEAYPWYWGLSKSIGLALQAGYTAGVLAFYDKLVHHVGHGSGNRDFTNTYPTKLPDFENWFKGVKAETINFGLDEKGVFIPGTAKDGPLAL